MLTELNSIIFINCKNWKCTLRASNEISCLFCRTGYVPGRWYIWEICTEQVYSRSAHKGLSTVSVFLPIRHCVQLSFSASKDVRMTNIFNVTINRNTFHFPNDGCLSNIQFPAFYSGCRRKPYNFILYLHHNFIQHINYISTRHVFQLKCSWFSASQPCGFVCLI